MQKPVPPGLVNLAVQTILAGVYGANAFVAENNPEKVRKYLKVIEDAANALRETTEGEEPTGEGDAS